jgi:hypothetical protein
LAEKERQVKEQEQLLKKKLEDEKQARQAAK